MRFSLGSLLMASLMFTCVFAAGQTRPAKRSPSPGPARPLFLQRVKSFEETQYVSKVVLKNGMIVVVNEYHPLPVVSLRALVKTGSGTEPADAAGISRIVLEMLFKGTTNRSLGVIRQDAQALGGVLTGTISYDATSVEMVVPAMQWKRALEIQSDLLLNPSFDSEELKKQTEAVSLETKEEQDVAGSFALEKLQELGFPGLRISRWAGRPESMRSLSREKLVEYYRAFYGPSRTILVVSGDVPSGEVLNEVVTLYDKPQPPGEKPLPAREEARQGSFRYSEIHGPVQFPRILFGYHTCPMTSQDYPAVEVLGAILGSGENAVLPARLRDEKKIILAGWAGLVGPPELGYLALSMQVETKDIDKSEIAALTQAELLKRKEPDAAVLGRAQAQLERIYWERLQTVSGRSQLLGIYEALGDWKGMDRYLTRLRQVKPADVSRVASKYLKLENCSLLELLPSAQETRNLTADSASGTFRGLLDSSVEEEEGEREHETQLALDIPTDSGNFKFSEVRSQFRTASILRGPDLFIKEDHSAPLIQVGFFFSGGKLAETDENSGITELMLRTMLRGGAIHGPERYMRQVELYGGQLRPVVTADYSGFSLSVLSRNAESALDLLGEAVKTAKLDKDEFERQKQLQLAEVRARGESMADYPRALMDRALFSGHPYARTAKGTEESLGALKAQDIQSWYQDVIRNKKPLVVILGDTQGTTLAGYFVKNFSGSRFQDVKLSETFAKPLEKGITLDEKWDKNTSLVGLAFQAPPEGDEDSYAMEVLRNYFSGSGGRLTVELCDKQALACGIRMEYEPLLRGGSIEVLAAAGLSEEDQVAKAVTAEFGKFLDGPVTYRDYRSAVNTAIGGYWIAQQSRSSEIASVVEEILAGKGIEEYQDYPAHIQEVKQDDLQEVARRFLKSDKSVTLRLNGRP